MGKKASRPPASKTSAAASPAISGLTKTSSKSSILKASFAPSDYQLALFASVIQGLDAQHLRIHDTNTGRLQCEHVLGPKETVTSLDWGYYPGKSRDRDQQSKKKRKRHSDVNGVSDGEQGDVVVAFGTSSSDIRMYSPSEDKIVGTLSGAHDRGVKDFKFTANRPAQEGWSIGGDNKLVQWDLRSGQSTKVVNLPESASGFSTLARPFPSNPPVICASQTPYIIDVENGDIQFDAMRNPIHTILASSGETAISGLFLTSDNDRYINVFDPQSRKLAMNLVAENEVSSLALYTPASKAGDSASSEKQVLAAVTDDGTIELFTRPFVLPKDTPNSKGAASLKAKRKQMTRRAESSLKIIRSESSSASVPVVTVSFQGPDLLVAWAEGGAIPVFERIKWLNEDTDELAFTGLKNVPRSKTTSVLGSTALNASKNASESHVDESRADVTEGTMADDDIEMDDQKQDTMSVDDSEEGDSDEEQTSKPKAKNGPQKDESDVEMDNASGSEEEEEGDDVGEPTFGDLMRANAAKEVDVEAELEDDAQMGALVPGKQNSAVKPIPTGVSLATVLAQSLKTNDNTMLESCFHTGDTSIIRATIQRLESSLAATLLQKLAERLSSRPSRYGHLLVWVQWTCVAHGGALAGNPELLKRMATLFKVMEQRSSSLSSLLLLKGKLDMLDAQLGLRQSIRSGAEGLESEDEDNVIYVEGQDEDEDEDSDADLAKHATTPRTKLIRDQTFDEDEESMLNAVQSGMEESDNDEDEDSDDDEEENQDIFDVEAEESAGSSDAEESLEEDEGEDDEDTDSVGSVADFIADTEDDEEEEAVTSRPPPKKAKLGGSGGGKGKNKAKK
ncbi:WD40 repeat and Utp12 domain-containing protein [Aspergillus candidus]|uniref:NUC189-domain-containing protein n=1 Tax=Aspergillus candidus TaxID=41067 RepID=A0A2I2FC71_ASPCN|nr:NUC189-domain-containing protein [Aspergillus candidus]PLB38238.1 NUC189-domain-containing protein [Aspergillus candidus]